jgi:hypothetical protein
MSTLAQDWLTSLVEWVTESSKSYPSPLNKSTTVLVGPFATFVPLALDHAPTQTFVADVLPIFIPAMQSIPNLPAAPQTSPESQDHAGSRACHLVWNHQQGRFKAAILALTDPEETLQSALDRQAPGVDLASLPVLAIPLWNLDATSRWHLLSVLPFISTD